MYRSRAKLSLNSLPNLVLDSNGLVSPDSEPSLPDKHPVLEFPVSFVAGLVANLRLDYKYAARSLPRT